MITASWIVPNMLFAPVYQRLRAIVLIWLCGGPLRMGKVLFKTTVLEDGGQIDRPLHRLADLFFSFKAHASMLS